MGPVNPDNRPLPAGWFQHYDTSKRTWYYVCTNIRPPQVSTTHPLGPPTEAPSPNGAPLGASEIYPSNSLTFPVAEIPQYTPEPPSPRSSNIKPKASNLSFAQQLYASATKPSQKHTPPSITIPSIPTPPLSPAPESIQRATHLLPNTPLSSGNKYASSHHSPSDFHLPAVASQHPQSQHGVHGPSHSFHSSLSHHNSSNHHAPYRAPSYQPPQTSDQQNSGHQRASTYSAGMMSKPKATPNFTTTLRPPPNGSYAQLQKKPDATPALQTIAAPPPHLQLQHAVNTNMSIAAPSPSYPSPPNSTSPASILNSSGYSLQQPVAPAPILPPQFVQQNDVMRTQASTTASQQQQPQQNSSALGQALGSFAVGMAGGALSAALGTQQGTSGSVSGAIGGALMNGFLGGNGDSMGSLMGGLSNTGAQSSGPDDSQLQAALQALPGADYQSLINSMVHKQAAQPASGVNYQALIAQLHPNAQQQHFNPAAGQTNIAPAHVLAAPANAYNAQLQAGQQQYQAALNTQSQQTSPAAVPGAVQAQQSQALLQVYNQQQQQQQHLQLQLQQHQQALYHQQALQQQLLQQQLQQVQAAFGQPPAQTQHAPHETPLGTLLTGLGQTFSNPGDYGNSADAGATASADGGVLSFFSDLTSEQ